MTNKHMRLALDTNILVYAEGIGDAGRCSAAVELLQILPSDSVILPAQCLGELFRVLTRKAGRNSAQARDAILGWADSYEIVDSTWSAFQSAMDIVADHKMQVWDGLILSVAAENRCRLLLSEDMQNGFTWRGVTVANPFASNRHPLLEAFLGQENTQ